MRIATWNIGEDERNENGYLTLESYKEIVNQIEINNIDMIYFQEAITYSESLPKISEYISTNTNLKYSTEFELSDSHINLGCKMGIVICSKYEISNVEKIMLDNPNLIYKVNDNITYYSHNKGFIMCDTKNIKLVSGHCLPFHVFKKNVLDYLTIFENMDNILFSEKNENIVLGGDMNYDDIKVMFPKFYSKSKEIINEPTRKDKQLDHLLVAKKLNVINSIVIQTCFDHKLCIVDIEL